MLRHHCCKLTRVTGLLNGIVVPRRSFLLKRQYVQQQSSGILRRGIKESCCKDAHYASSLFAVTTCKKSTSSFEFQPVISLEDFEEDQEAEIDGSFVHTDNSESMTSSILDNISAEVLANSHPAVINKLLVLGSEEFTIVNYTAQLFGSLHDVLGMPWWGAILAGTAIIRALVLFPLHITGARASTNYALFHPKFLSAARTLQSKYQMARVKGEFKTDKEMNRAFGLRLKRERQRFFVQNKCHPSLNALSPIASIAMFFAMTFSVRSLMVSDYSIVDGAVQVIDNVSFHTGGLLFCSDFLAPDTSLILPVLRFLLTMAACELPALRSGDQMSLYMRSMLVLMRTATVYMLYVSTVVPSGIVYYWFVSSLLALVQQLLMMHPRVLQFFKIGVVDKNPYRTIANRAKHRYRFFLRPLGVQ